MIHLQEITNQVSATLPTEKLTENNEVEEIAENFALEQLAMEVALYGEELLELLGSEDEPNYR